MNHSDNDSLRLALLIQILIFYTASLISQLMIVTLILNKLNLTKETVWILNK